MTIDRDRTSINLNEGLESLVPASKISDLPTGWVCGQVARDFVKTKTGFRDNMDIQEADEFKTSKFFCKTDFGMADIAKEEAAYLPLPKFYSWPTREARERTLYDNYLAVTNDIKLMVKEIQQYKLLKK